MFRRHGFGIRKGCQWISAIFAASNLSTRNLAYISAIWQGYLNGILSNVFYLAQPDPAMPFSDRRYDFFGAGDPIFGMWPISVVDPKT
jgi:hypothetical protein